MAKIDKMDNSVLGIGKDVGQLELLHWAAAAWSLSRFWLFVIPWTVARQPQCQARGARLADHM